MVEAVSTRPASVRFTPFRGLAWVAMMLFCLNAVVDVLVFHGVALSSNRKAEQPVSWAATPYTSLRAKTAGRTPTTAKLSWSNWYPKNLAISRSGLSRVHRASERAGVEFERRYLKP